MPLRDLVPARVRAAVRSLAADLPYRGRDLPSDLAEALRLRRGLPLPPAPLRARVGANSSRAEFLEIGQACAADLLRVAERHAAAPGRWLDFGAGCGRVSRHLLDSPLVGSFTGVDVDAPLVSWARRHLPGEWRATGPAPPLPFEPESFDLVVAVSVFTHLDEPAQTSWLAELRRVLRPGGLLFASTHPPLHAAELPAPYRLDPEEVSRRGFVHVSSIGPFNHQSSFHSADYLKSSWSRFFTLRELLPRGLAGYQDLSVWVAGPAGSQTIIQED